MKKMPQLGDEVKMELANKYYKINKKLGDGTQGQVYEVEKDGCKLALKWYKPNKATIKQRKMIRELIRIGAPCSRFLWPLDLAVSDKIAGFGYIMDLRAENYKSISELVARRVEPSFKVLCTIAYQLADSYRQLHSRGYCYRDINFNNIFFDPQTGDILICDNDNVGIDGVSEASVLGTQRFMAPEVVRGEKKPSTNTDLFSLAVLLFYIFINNHPLHGKKESQIRCFDLPAMKKIYGEEPVFIFDPQDSSNQPDPREHKNALLSWPLYPQFVKKLFIQSFTKGLNNPNQRVREGQWRKIMLRLRDSIFYCAHCGAENFFDPAKMSVERPGQCWNCKQQLELPYRINIDDAIENTVMLTHEAKLYPHHLKSTSKRDFSQPLAEVVQHPRDPSIWGLKNLDNKKWRVTTKASQIKEVEPGKSVVLASGVEINFGNRYGQIIY
ncbi:serine/threonine protein kinase [Halanaerobacter jeridensis]|uniref:Serine/threonine protein kinase n=1 Tax=Halanaerobacter jeridensis TaxID=706427 RepID=A0A938XQA9_9FIRM|nr:serine/threonine-protein kinase [Halanaerobacter jeridensis]MBM7555496.1 serine/threonine protein kinase [Halanaerobacter jeridensis]